jgi:phenylalanyl-tRNA synthetase beta chain
MKFSYSWLQSLLTEPLPAPQTLAEVLTFHSSEVEDVEAVGTDTMLEVKVLPDKSAWLMSHRGLAKELSVILKNPLQADPFAEVVSPLQQTSEMISLSLETEACDFYSATLITGIKVAPSPQWLVDSLATIGQRSINNIVDATNYVMFELGQPLHAFDAGKLGTNPGYAITVRSAYAGEEIITLTGETYQLSLHDTVIVDAVTDTPIGIAGIKGGKKAAVDATTTSILIESAHFNRFTIRQTTKLLRLVTDASKRYENGLVPGVAPIAMKRVVALITSIANGEVIATAVAGDTECRRPPVSVSLLRVNSVLGVTLAMPDIAAIFTRFGYTYEIVGDTITVTPPFERDDLRIAEDLIEEIGRIHGLQTITSIPPKPLAVTEFNARFYYAEKIRTMLIGLGFSEVYTSSFRNHDKVKLENALATDKGYLRSTLIDNIKEARMLNVPHRDLLGLSAIKIFEIGTVFADDYEECRVAIAVQTNTAYKAKVDDVLLNEALSAVTDTLGVKPEYSANQDGVVEFSLDAYVRLAPPIDRYEPVIAVLPSVYKPFSPYPAVTRDIAMWVQDGTLGAVIAPLLAKEAGQLCVRSTHIDTFTKEGKVSQAFRLVFQSKEKTLTDEEVQVVMGQLYSFVTSKGWEVR